MIISPLRAAFFVVVIAAGLAGACGGNKVQVATSSAADASNVARYETYAHDVSATPPAGHTVGERSSTVIDKARVRVDAELQRKGYKLVPEGEARMMVLITSGVKTVVDQPTGRAAAEGAPSEADTVSTLVVDMRDRATGKALFHGSAQKEIHSKNVADKDVNEAVAQIVEPIPPAAR